MCKRPRKKKTDNSAEVLIKKQVAGVFLLVKTSCILEKSVCDIRLEEEEEEEICNLSLIDTESSTDCEFEIELMTDI